MFKFFAGCRKEVLILLRDKAGLIILFIMPTIMVITFSLLQEIGWSSVTRELSIKVLFLDNDQDSLGIKISKGLRNSNFFEIVDSLEGKPVTESSIHNAVKKGDYLIGIIVPKGLTRALRGNVRLMVAKTMAGFGLYDQGMIGSIPLRKADTIMVFFDPTIKKTFKNAILSNIREYSYKIETEMIFRIFNAEMAKVFPGYQPPEQEYGNMVEFREIYPTYKKAQDLPDTSQHNVPSWTVFAMFFIVIPFTNSMMTEREEGSFLRIQSMPVSHLQLLLSKVGVYLIVCFFQAFLMIMAGKFILPLFGAVPLHLGSAPFALILLTVITALAALGFGLMVGTIASTHQQASAFGSVAVVIMAALGGLFVPMYLMSPLMLHIAALSPLNWALTGYYDIFLRGGGLPTMYHQIIKLFLFFLISVAVIVLFRKLKNPLNK